MKAQPFRKVTEEVFWARIDASDRYGCHLWIGPQTNKGRPRAFVDGEEMDGRKALHFYITGEIDDDHKFFPTCGNPLCLNREHVARVKKPAKRGA